MLVRPFRQEDEIRVIELWRRCGLVRPANDPRCDIARKLAHSPELFLVGTITGEVVATAMAGYDGHRGWINYLAVTPERQNAGLGKLIMTVSRAFASGTRMSEDQRAGADHKFVASAEFYDKIGFVEDAVTSLGKATGP